MAYVVISTQNRKAGRRRNKNSIKEDSKRNLSIWALKIKYVEALWNGKKCKKIFFFFFPQMVEVAENNKTMCSPKNSSVEWGDGESPLSAEWQEQAGTKAKKVKWARACPR